MTGYLLGYGYAGEFIKSGILAGNKDSGLGKGNKVGTKVYNSLTR